MSTRHARTADKALNERLSKILKELLKQPANKYCADCKRKDPRWASWNIGIFVCIRCSGVHRSMGTHISKVKSVDLDTWIPEQVENMQRWGNERANKYWEANLKDMRPSESNIDMWIRAKYEQKRWAMKGPIPDPSTLGGDDLETPSSPASPQRASQITTTTTTTKKDFINLDDFLGSPSSSPAQSAKSTPSAAAQLQGADFFLNNPSQPAKQPAASAASTEQQDDFKSKILSLYNQTPPAATTLNNNANGGYLNNMSNYQQQLSGLSMGTGIIPQAPPGHSFQNVWGSFTSAPPAQQQTAALPQGSQFFTSASNGSPGPGKKQQQQPAYDAFADLLK